MSDAEAAFTVLMAIWSVIGLGIIAGMLIYSRMKYGTWLP